MFLFLLGIAILAIVVHIIFMKQRSSKKIIEVILLYLLVVNIGLGGVISFIGHVFRGPETAAMIGWPAGSPFQYEVGVADLAFGLLGVFCLFFRGNFWLAAIVANSVFLWGCMIGHVRSLSEAGNTAAYNIGPNILFAGLVMPFLLIGLYAALKAWPQRKS